VDQKGATTILSPIASLTIAKCFSQTATIIYFSKKSKFLSSLKETTIQIIKQSGSSELREKHCICSLFILASINFFLYLQESINPSSAREALEEFGIYSFDFDNAIFPFFSKETNADALI
jgi:hypothetical protein